MLLRVEGLTTCIWMEDGPVAGVRDVSFCLESGSSLGLVGETGCGKTLLALSILKLVRWPVQVTAGRVLLEGEDLLRMDSGQLRTTRGNRIGFVFQEPAQSFDPLVPVGSQIREVILNHRSLSHREAQRESIRVIGRVGIPEPESRARAYPHQLSGGMLQRMAIAIAIASSPQLMIADEPTTALDVTTRLQILDLLRDLRESSRMALLLVSHDLGVVSYTAERVLVMYGGRVVENADRPVFFSEPWHPYSKGLLAAHPRSEDPGGIPAGIPGEVPALRSLPGGCSFHPRCPDADAECREGVPILREFQNRACACFRLPGYGGRES